MVRLTASIVSQTSHTGRAKIDYEDHLEASSRMDGLPPIPLLSSTLTERLILTCPSSMRLGREDRDQQAKALHEGKMERQCCLAQPAWQGRCCHLASTWARWSKRRHLGWHHERQGTGISSMLGALPCHEPHKLNQFIQHQTAYDGPHFKKQTRHEPQTDMNSIGPVHVHPYLSQTRSCLSLRVIIKHQSIIYLFKRKTISVQVAS